MIQHVLFMHFVVFKILILVFCIIIWYYGVKSHHSY